MGNAFSLDDIEADIPSVNVTLPNSGLVGDAATHAGDWASSFIRTFTARSGGMAPASVLLQFSVMGAICVLALLFYLHLYLQPDKQNVYAPRRFQQQGLLLQDAQHDYEKRQKKAAGQKRTRGEREEKKVRDKEIADALEIGLDFKAYLVFQQCCCMILFLSSLGALGVAYCDLQYNSRQEMLTKDSWIEMLSMAKVTGPLVWMHYGYAIYMSFATCITVWIYMKHMVARLAYFEQQMHLPTLSQYQRERYFGSKKDEMTWILVRMQPHDRKPPHTDQQMTGGIDMWISILEDNGNYDVNDENICRGRKLEKMHRYTYRWNSAVLRLEKSGAAYATAMETLSGTGSYRVTSNTQKEELQRRADKHWLEFEKAIKDLATRGRKLESYKAKQSKSRNFIRRFLLFEKTATKPTDKKLVYDRNSHPLSNNFGFALFRDHCAARYQVWRMQSAERPLWAHFLSLFFHSHVELAPTGDAICFKGINRSRAVRWVESIRGTISAAIVVVIYTFLIIAISGIANAISFVPTVPWLNAWYHWELFGQPIGKRSLTIIVGAVPPALTSAVKYFLPGTLRKMAHIRGAATFLELDRLTISWLFAVLILCHLTCFTLAGQIQNVVAIGWAEAKESGLPSQGFFDALKAFPKLAVEATIRTSNYWLTWYALNAAICMYDLCQPVRYWRLVMVKWFNRHRWYERSLREVKETTCPPHDFTITKHCSNFLLMQAVAFTYAALCPLVMILAFAACTVHFWVDTRQMTRVYRTRGEGHGHLFRMLINRLLFSVGFIHVLFQAMTVSFGFGTGVLLALGPATMVGLFKLQMSYDILGHLGCGRGRPWSLDESFDWGSEVYHLSANLRTATAKHNKYKAARNAVKTAEGVKKTEKKIHSLRPLNPDDFGTDCPPVPNFLRQPRSLDECQEGVKNKHPTEEICRAHCEINDHIINPYFTPKHYELLNVACQTHNVSFDFEDHRYPPLVALLKWLKLDVKRPLDKLMTRVTTEPLKVRDSLARRWKD